MEMFYPIFPYNNWKVVDTGLIFHEAMMKPSIFFTSRFRSGSTMIWNLFRRLNNVHTYYEPLHELLPCFMRYPAVVHREHFFVESYFDEYTVASEALAQHQNTFGADQLYLEHGDEHKPLKNYLDALMDAIPEQALGFFKFNRVDFRLDWLKQQYPQIPLLHLARNPRDQWYSSIGAFRQVVDNEIDFDHYFSTTWARDLCRQFPFLASPYIEHAYQRFYYLWKLSLIAGQRQADLSVMYEDVLANPMQQVANILKFAGLFSEENLNKSVQYVLSNPERSWVRDHEDSWFADLEQKCEMVLDELGLNASFALKPLAEIQAASPRYQELLDTPAASLWSIQSFKHDISNLHVATYEFDYARKRDARLAEQTRQELTHQAAAERLAFNTQQDQLNQELAALHSQYLALQQQLTQAAAEKEQLQQLIGQEQAKSADLEIALERMGQEKDQAQTALEQERAHSLALQARLEGANQELDAVLRRSEQEKEQSQRTLEQVQHMLAQEQERANQLERDYNQILHSRSYRLMSLPRLLMGRARVVREKWQNVLSIKK